MREKPKMMEMYKYTETLKPVAPPDVVLLVEEEELDAEDWMLATWVPAKAKKRNMVVPTNSPIVATKSVVRFSCGCCTRMGYKTLTILEVAVHPLCPWESQDFCLFLRTQILEIDGCPSRAVLLLFVVVPIDTFVVADPLSIRTPFSPFQVAIRSRLFEVWF
jgi:hypothetical protein